MDNRNCMPNCESSDIISIWLWHLVSSVLKSFTIKFYWLILIFVCSKCACTLSKELRLLRLAWSSICLFSGTATCAYGFLMKDNKVNCVGVNREKHVLFWRPNELGVSSSWCCWWGINFCFWQESLRLVVRWTVAELWWCSKVFHWRLVFGDAVSRGKYYFWAVFAKDSCDRD